MYYYRLIEDEKVSAFIARKYVHPHYPVLSLNGNCNTKLEEFTDFSAQFICVIQKGESYPSENLLSPLGQNGFPYLEEIKVLKLSASANCPELTADWSKHVELINVEVCTFDVGAGSCSVHTNPGTEGTPTVRKITIDPEDPIYTQINELELDIEELKKNIETSNETLKQTLENLTIDPEDPMYTQINELELDIEELKKNIETSNETLKQTLENFITNPVKVDLKIPENELKPLTEVISNSITNVGVTAELVTSLREVYQNIAKSTVDAGASAAQVATEMQIWRQSVSDFLQKTAQSNITLTETVKKYEQVQQMQSDSFAIFNNLVCDTLSEVRCKLADILEQRQAELRAQSSLNSDIKVSIKSFLNSPVVIALGSGLGLLFAVKLIKEVVRG